MSAISIDDLNNAKVDVGTVADFATSLQTTVTDRLGNTKPTLNGIAANLGSVINRGAWATATVYAALTNIVTQGGVIYQCLIGHTSGTFSTDLAAGKWTVYQGLTSADTSDADFTEHIGYGVLTLKDKLSTLLRSVTEDGAIGDGTTDNTSAFATNAAANPGGVMYVPKSASPFKINVTVPGFDFDKLVGPGRVLWNGLTLDLSKARRPVPECSPEALLARYASGGTGIGLACYGNSLTAGVNSTNYADNTGSPTYNSVVDHSWPVVASRTVRQMFQRNTSDTNFTFYNAGKAGMQLIDGWALTNLQTYVLTPYGSVAQACILDWGVNDGWFGSGVVVDDFVRELRNLVMFLRSYDLEPAVLSLLPIPRVRNDEIERQLTHAMGAVCAALQVKFIDATRYMRQLVGAYGYTALWGSTDGVHPIDAGYNAWSTSILRAVAGRWIVDADEGDHVSQADARTSSWPLSSESDASWAAGTTHYTYLTADGLAVRYDPALGASAMGSQQFIWHSGRRREKLVYRCSSPPENTTPTGGIIAAANNLSLSAFGQGGSAYVSRNDIAGWRRVNYETPVECPSIVGELQPGLSWARVTTGAVNSAVRYLGRLQVVPAAAHGTSQIAPLASATPAVAVRSFGPRRWALTPTGTNMIVYPDEDADLSNVLSFSGNGSQLHATLALAEGTGLIVMSGLFINTGTGAPGRWAYMLYRSTGADNNKLFLFRLVPGASPANLVGTPTASGQTLGTSATVLLVLDKSGNEYRMRLFDGDTTSATLLWTYTSTSATSGTTTTVEAPPIAGAAFGAYALGSGAGGEVILSSAVITRDV